MQLVTGQKAAQPLIQLVESESNQPLQSKIEPEDPHQNSGKKSKKTKQAKKAPEPPVVVVQ